ncbi:hypothetical protein TVAG_343420 [Trichomonas vaginalis G3]|uniref:Uncharacterized protein n=1 Tax=Trichomonas vaginalis (strain ATCC PRA-98 / G3) TaxID=412133 RepID=A2E1E6_TRIV3|nr:beta-lactamase family [Trichomonas vaginalis G3]EAY13513.1 hypothetical protein TVAG_343420 [Trichomonas vaginalis G3]KAI5529222.1 beta-lactamase family [Trichomonas vaginalis G3]|eukprot:XP_001325736.1 hypothetical protein [Trichomonas vaginalis G3]
MSHIQKLQTFEIKYDKDKNQFTFLNQHFVKSLDNLYSNIDMKNDSAVGTYHISFVYEENTSDIEGIFMEGSPMTKVPKSEISFIKYTVDVIYGLGLFALIVCIISLTIVLTLVFKKKDLKPLKYLIVCSVINFLCIIEPVFLFVTKSINNFVDLEWKIQLLVFIIIGVSTLRLLFSVISIVIVCVIIYDNSLEGPKSIQFETVDLINPKNDETGNHQLPVCIQYVAYSCPFITLFVSVVLTILGMILGLYKVN